MRQVLLRGWSTFREGSLHVETVIDCVLSELTGRPDGLYAVRVRSDLDANLLRFTTSEEKSRILADLGGGVVGGGGFRLKPQMKVSFV